MTSPLYAIGGVVMLAAARTYPYDLAFVAAESERTAEIPLRMADRPVALVTAPMRGPGLDTLHGIAEVVYDPWIEHQPLRLYDAPGWPNE